MRIVPKNRYAISVFRYMCAKVTSGHGDRKPLSTLRTARKAKVGSSLSKRSAIRQNYTKVVRDCTEFIKYRTKFVKYHMKSVQDPTVFIKHFTKSVRDCTKSMKYFIQSLRYRLLLVRNCTKNKR